MEGDDKKKAHRVSKSIRKLKNPKEGKKKQENVDPKIRNPKAFAYNSVVRAERKFRRAKDLETKKDRAPDVDRTPVEPPPFVIAIVGPAKVGKSTLFHNLVKHFTRQTLQDVKGPVTIVTGKRRRLTLIECNNDINSMIDTAKIADLVLLLVDASFGFEMEVFEFLNICQVHGFPQIMGVLTHLDLFKNKTQLKKTKKTLKHRFWTEVYPGSKLFYLSGYYPSNGSYPKNEIQNLARFISVMKFRQTIWRSEHSYVISDRMEDITSPDQIRVNPKVDRNICLYGYVHGTYLKPLMAIHIPGLGDFSPEAVTALDDPCPLPMKERVLRRSLNEKEKVIYAPFSGVGGIVYDHDAVYIDLGGSHSHRRKEGDNQVEIKSPFVTEMRALKATLDEKMESAGMKLFSTSDVITPSQMDVDDQWQFDEDDDEEELEADLADVVEPKEAGSSECESILGQKTIQVVKANDGRIRRKVMFDTEDDDILHEMKREIKALKQSEDKDTREDDEMSLDSEPVENDESVIEPKLKFASTRSTLENTGNEDTDVNVMNLAYTLKTRLAKQEGKSPEALGLANTVLKKDEVDEAESSDDDESDPEEEWSGEEGNEVASANESVDNEDKHQFGEDPDSISRTKKKRYEEAEDGFYSRFRKRSMQKMVYDATTEYMNVGSQADFDLTNCSVEQLQGKVSDEGIQNEESLRNLFVGGDYAETAQKILDADDEDNAADDGFGEFEELDKECGDEKGDKDPDKAAKKREEIKKKLKEKFDMEYDDDGGEKSFYQDWKSQVEEQTKINRSFFKDVDDKALLQDLQGLAQGTYVRILLTHVPCEFVTNFDPQSTCPLIMGSLDSPNQETLAVLQARVKKHRWHPRILKSRDPIILSIGWRRFQTLSIYSVHDHNMRNRMIKYTPEHLHCVANFFGPVTPQGTGILGIAPNNSEGFRITLTGSILDMDKRTELVKKLKLIGSPAKIFKKSAFINGMFNSPLEVAKFVGAKIKTVSGIRGVIKKPLRAPPGSFRATFEDRILLSDIVFCRTWAKMEIPKFYLSIPNHVLSNPRLLKTVGQLKREGQIRTEPNPDNLYTPIERKPKEFKPLKIPKRLQERLPYKDKPKVQAKLMDVQRIAVIKEPYERKMTKLLNVMKSRMNEKEGRERADKAKKAAERTKLMKKLEEKQTYRQKELRKKVFRTLGTMNKNPDKVTYPTGGNKGGKNERKRFKKRR